MVGLNTSGRRQSKTPILSRNIDQKSIETVFSIVICLHTGDKWQSKTLFLSIFDPRLSIVDNVSDRCLPGVVNIRNQGTDQPSRFKFLERGYTKALSHGDALPY